MNFQKRQWVVIIKYFEMVGALWEVKTKLQNVQMSVR